MSDLVPAGDRASADGTGDRYPKLLPWQRVYAGWLAQHEKDPVLKDKLAEAKVAAGYQVKKAELQKLESRADFRGFLNDMQADFLGAARQRFQSQMLQTIEEHQELRRLAYEQKDYKEHLRYVNPVIDRIWPKDDQKGPAKTLVVIQMGQGSFAAKETANVTEVVVEESDVVIVEEPE